MRFSGRDPRLEIINISDNHNIYIFLYPSIYLPVMHVVLKKKTFLRDPLQNY